MSPRIAGTDTGETRETILKASERLFAEKGFAGTGIDAIARKAGISKSVIYYHFENKDAIRDAIIENFIDDVMVLKEQAASRTVSRPTTVNAGVRVMMDFFRNREDAVKILMMQTMLQDGPDPLFTLWDRNTEIAIRFRHILLGESEETHADDHFMPAYFLMLLPVMSYFAHADRWCKHYNMDRDAADRMFADAVARQYSRFMTPEYGLENLTREED